MASPGQRDVKTLPKNNFLISERSRFSKRTVQIRDYREMFGRRPYFIVAWGNAPGT
jgi:hypothetical protein